MAPSFRPSPQSTITVIQAQEISELLSRREGKKFRFFRFMNLGKLSLVFESEDKEQRVITMDNAKSLIQKGTY